MDAADAKEKAPLELTALVTPKEAAAGKAAAASLATEAVSENEMLRTIAVTESTATAAVTDIEAAPLNAAVSQLVWSDDQLFPSIAQAVIRKSCASF
jgi:hypothetical protein